MADRFVAGQSASCVGADEVDNEASRSPEDAVQVSLALEGC